nr:dUTP diphosphatase [Alteribacter populi]
MRKQAEKHEAESIPVKVKRLHPDAKMPAYAHDGDAGFDLVAIEDTVIEPGETALIKTGLAFEIPEGFEMQVRPRSGVSLKTNLRVSNAPGTVDSNYRGEVGVIVDNIADKPPEKPFVSLVGGIDGKVSLDDGGNLYDEGTYIIRKGDKIAQAVLNRVPQAEFIEVDKLGATDRGEGGFGSSGYTTKGAE